MAIAEALLPEFDQEMAHTRKKRSRLLDVPVPAIYGLSADEGGW